jgi:DNA-binding PadR family transcriptional regulator
MQEEAYWENLVKRSLCRFFLLAELAKGPAHGYRVNQGIQEACGGCCGPTEAMVYSTLKELTEGGYVACATETHGGRQRRVCSLTDTGFEAFHAAGRVWEKMLPQVRQTARLALSRPQELKLVGLTKGGER